MKKFLVYLIFLTFSVSFAISAQHTHSENEIYLPQEKPGQNTETTLKEFKTPGLDGWSVISDELTGTPYRAFGKPVQIPGISYITSDNAKYSSLAFLEKFSGEFGIDIANLEFVRQDKVRGMHGNNRWYVTFRQKHYGMDVIGSEIELRISEDAKVFALGIVYYNEINLPESDIIPADEAFRHASEPFKLTASTEHLLSAYGNNLKILPIRDNGSLDFRKVYQIDFNTSEPYNSYTSFVDANSGQVLRRVNQTHNYTSVSFVGGAKKHSPADEETDGNFPYLNVFVNGEKKQLDGKGQIRLAIDDSTTISAGLEGQYCRVIYKDHPMADLKEVIPPGENFYEVRFDNSNSHRYERNMYINFNFIRNWILEIDPDIDFLDYQQTIILYHDYQMTNAYSSANGDTIAFLNTGDLSTLMADGSSVLYHEYGHSINTTFYQSRGTDMMNYACHEGTADVTTALVLDDPKVGYGVFANDKTKVIRNCDNNNRYPEDIRGESHHDGQILAGAFWDLREATSLEYVSKIHHFARYGLPDDVNTGRAFMEWFIETLIADDDDNDLSNGTPNSEKIIKAFDKHGIGFSLILNTGFKHTPLSDIDDPAEAREAEFSFEIVDLPGFEIESATLVYSTDSFDTSNEVEAENLGSLPESEGLPAIGFKAEIPALNNAGFVEYYIKAKLTGNDDEATFMDEGNNYFKYLAGYKQVYSNDFEKLPDGWSTQALDDEYETGGWVYGDPKGTYFGNSSGWSEMQPEDDHSPDGTKCFMTGNDGNSISTNALIDGRTTLTSEIFDISEFKQPLIKFYMWFYNLYYSGYEAPSIKIYLVNEANELPTDDTKLVFENTDDFDGWEPVYLSIPIEMTNSEKLRLKFVATSPTAGRYPQYLECLIDDLEILDINSSGNVNSIISVVESGIAIYPNPASDKIFIDAPGKFPGGYDYKIIDINGNTALSGSFGNSAQLRSIDISGKLSTGYYSIILTDGRDIVSGKLIVR